MYKYFVSFKVYYSNGKTGSGNIVLESNVRISDFDNIDDMNQWIINMQNWIKEKLEVESVIIMNFVFLK